MKKLSILFALAAMLMLPTKLWSEVTMTFKYVNTSNELITDAGSSYNSPISVYSQGVSVATVNGIRDDSWNFTGTWSMTFDDALAGKVVSYETSYGQRGTFTVTEGETLTATLVTLTVTVKDTEGQPVSDAYVRIYAPNGNSNSYYTNSDGQFTTYFAASTGYSWSWGEQSGTFDMTADYALNITKQAATSFSLSVKGRYGDYPVSTGSWYVYKYGDTENTVANLYSGNSVKLDAGDYWVKDEMGMFSDRITLSADMVYWVEYHKVTFKSMTGSKPNTDQRIQVYFDRDAWSNKSATTNADGEATMYLRAGVYTYRHMDTYTEFTVGNADQTVAINTSSITFTLDWDATAAEAKNQNFRWAKDDGNSYDNNVYPEDGKIVISPVMPGNYKLTINNANTVNVTVAEGENAQTIKLYALQFTTNIETTNQVYVNDGVFRMDFNKKYYLQTGDYAYGLNYYGQPIGTVSLTQNTDIPINYGTLTVTVRDGQGVVAGEQVSFGGNYGETDENGQVKFTRMVGEYELRVPYCYVTQTFDLKAGDNATTVTIPNQVTFNMLRMGEPLNSNGMWIEQADDNTISYQAVVKEGVAKVRLDPTKTYIIGAYHGKTAITEGCTISLGKINVTCDGMGIALPMENWDATSTYYVLVGSVVRLAAIPVSGIGFQKWVINGAEYTEGMIDLTIKDVETTAKAVFGGTAPTYISQKQTNASFRSDDSFIYLPDDVEGTVSIFSMDGKQMKSLGVAGKQVGIYDLPAGAYIVTLNTNDGETKVARFLKQ